MVSQCDYDSYFLVPNDVEDMLCVYLHLCSSFVMSVQIFYTILIVFIIGLQENFIHQVQHQ